MTLPSVLGCQVCSALEKQNVPLSKVFFGAKCASAAVSFIHNFLDQKSVLGQRLFDFWMRFGKTNSKRDV